MIDEDEKMPLMAHLQELRTRLLRVIYAVGVGFVICYFFKERLFDILAQPLTEVMGEGDKLVFTGVSEAFFTYIKVAGLAGIGLASPFIFYQFWMFVAPGLYRNEKKTMIPVVILSTFFFVGGALFGYFLVFPWGFKFFLGFASETIQPLPSMKEYLSFATKLLLAFGVAFELPLILTFMARMGMVSVAYLKKNRKYALLLFFIGAAIITPPDVVTQVMLALPLMFLYELSIVGARIFGRKRWDEDMEDDPAPKSKSKGTKDE